MTLAQRNRFRTIFAVGLIIIVAITMGVRIAIAPMTEQMIRTQVDNQASDAINSAIADQISAGDFDYNKMVTIEKNDAGTVTAIRTNIAELNRLKTGVLEQIDTRLESLSLEQLSIPIGSIVLPELFSGKGPAIPVHILAIRNSDAAFTSHFAQAGINQTLHQLIMEVNVDAAVLVLGQTSTFSISSQVVVAETVIVGQVPNTFIQAGGEALTEKLFP